MTNINQLSLAEHSWVKGIQRRENEGQHSATKGRYNLKNGDFFKSL